MNYSRAQIVKKIAVVGAGPAGMAAAAVAAGRGHQVTLFEKEGQIGGQFNMAKKIPGKEEFKETLRYFNKQIELNGVDLQLNKTVVSEDLSNFDEIVWLVYHLENQIYGINHEKVITISMC